MNSMAFKGTSTKQALYVFLIVIDILDIAVVFFVGYCARHVSKSMIIKPFVFSNWNRL